MAQTKRTGSLRAKSNPSDLCRFHVYHTHTHTRQTGLIGLKEWQTVERKVHPNQEADDSTDKEDRELVVFFRTLHTKRGFEQVVSLSDSRPNFQEYYFLGVDRDEILFRENHRTQVKKSTD